MLEDILHALPAIVAIIGIYINLNNKINKLEISGDVQRDTIKELKEDHSAHRSHINDKLDRINQNLEKLNINVGIMAEKTHL